MKKKLKLWRQVMSKHLPYSKQRVHKYIVVISELDRSTRDLPKIGAPTCKHPELSQHAINKGFLISEQCCEMHVKWLINKFRQR